MAVDIFKKYKQTCLSPVTKIQQAAKFYYANDICRTVKKRLYPVFSQLPNLVKKEINEDNPQEAVPEVGCYICGNIQGDIQLGSIAKGFYYARPEPYLGEDNLWHIQYDPMLQMEKSKCPDGFTIIGSVHTHPMDDDTKGEEQIEDNLLPSLIDLKATGPQEQNLTKCVIGSEGEIKGRTYCWRIPDEQVEQVIGGYEEQASGLQKLIDEIKSLINIEDAVVESGDKNNELSDKLDKMIEDYSVKERIYLNGFRDVIDKFGCKI